MGKLLITQEEAVKRMSEAHNGFYSYGRAVFTGATNKITVTCPIHGDFSTIYCNHTAKKDPTGCRSCSYGKRAGKRTHPKNDFLFKAAEVHGDRYSYLKVDYKNKSTKVEIVCDQHGSFFQTPEKHLIGQGCIVCCKRAPMVVERFKELATARHGDKYLYDAITDDCFVGNKSKKVPINCKTHGIFKQHFGNHIQGQGCRKCASFGFKTNKAGYLYIISCGDITKVGITNRDVHLRVQQISKSFGAEFSILKTFYFKDGQKCLDTETKVLEYLSGFCKRLEAKFNGSTECFLSIDKISLFDNIVSIMEGVEHG